MRPASSDKTISKRRFIRRPLALSATWPRAQMTLRRDGRVLHFVMQRGSEAAVLAAHRLQGARLLRVGQTLDWTVLEGECWFVMAL